MPDKAILYYICNWSHVYSLIDGLVPVSFGRSVCLILLFFLWVYKPLHLLQSFSNSSIGDPMLSPMVGCEHLPLYLSGSGRASQETAVSVVSKHFLASTIVSAFVDCIQDESRGGVVFEWPFL